MEEDKNNKKYICVSASCSPYRKNICCFDCEEECNNRCPENNKRCGYYKK